jgi:hypothetical protein
MDNLENTVSVGEHNQGSRKRMQRKSKREQQSEER